MLDEKRDLYPRVSEIISRQSDELKAIDPLILSRAAARGTQVHSYCTAWSRNLWIGEIDPELAPYVEKFISWANENIQEIVASEHRMFEDTLCFTGEVDFVAKLKSGKIALLDLKTSSSKSPSWPLQLAAYRHLCEIHGFVIEEVVNIHLKRTKPARIEQERGEKVVISPPEVKLYEVRWPDLTPYWEIFSSALKCYNYFVKKERPCI